MNPLKTFLKTLPFALCLFAFSHSVSAMVVSDTDVWDIKQGSVITANSPVLNYSSSYRSDIRDMFGGNYGVISPTYTLFGDFLPAGTVHWVEWQTPGAVTLNAFNLVAAHDGAPRDANYRGIREFSLFSWSGSAWNPLYDYFPSNPYGGGTNYTGSNYLELYDHFPEVTAQKFRAEFVQYGDVAGNASGPRIYELDGYLDTPSTAVPEPATTALFGLGLAGAGFIRRKRKK